MKSILHTKIFLYIFFLFLLPLFSYAQKTKVSLRDSLDRALDLSDYIIHKNGFVPVPIIITEPAFGGFGGGLVPVFIKRRPAYIDSVGNVVKFTPVAPDITGAVGLYTVNKSWATAAFRQGTFVKWKLKYMIGGAYANINMSFFRDVKGNDTEFKFNIKAAAAFLQATKRICQSHWYTGIKYLFLDTRLEYTGDKILPEGFVKEDDYSGTISQLGAVVELDNRDNIFTPNHGLKLHLEGLRSDNIFGSDYEFWRLNYFMYAYATVFKKFVTGLRIDGQQTFDEPPFYMLPYINMRGIPMVRYQGNATILAEGEVRWDFFRRWSIMLFSGSGKAFDEWSDFGDADLVTSYGTGFRYLLARQFKMRMGLDVARGPDTWAYYIVFGTNWLK